MKRLIYTDTLLLSQTVERYPSVTTSIQGYAEKDFVLYPNPAHDHLTLEFAKPVLNNGELRILNVSGNVELRERIDHPVLY